MRAGVADTGVGISGGADNVPMTGAVGEKERKAFSYQLEHRSSKRG